MLTLRQRMRPDHYAWLHAKLALIVWAVLFLRFTPVKVESALGVILAAGISGMVIIGTGVSVVGLFMSLSASMPKARQGLNVELSGLWVALVGGPAVYCLTQFALSWGPEGDQRIALTAFAYALTALLFVRIVIVGEHRKRVSA